jgi:hypothetical protein
MIVRFVVVIGVLDSGVIAQSNRLTTRPFTAIDGSLLEQLKAEGESLKTLSHEDLVDRYCDHAAKMTGVGVPYEDLSFRTAIVVWDAETERLAMLKREIVSRGSAIGPLLIAELKDHAARNADLERSASPPRGIARELMDMLAQIGEARAAPVMMDLLTGKIRCNRFVSRSAVEHIEKLTLVRFRKFDPHNTSYAVAVRGPDATVDPHKEESREAFARELAGKYERFIRQHPVTDADATPWAKQAVRMARVWLGSDDLSEAYNAATFLRSGRYRPRVIDDSPGRTTDQIAEILEQCEVASSEKSNQGVTYYTYRHKPTGQVLPVTVYNWAELLTSGPSVSPQYARLLIRIDREMPDYPGGMATYLFKVGGTEAMAYRIEAYRRLSVEINKAGKNPTTEISSEQDRALQPTLRHCQFFRWGIERWAGRTFATDAELDAWWSLEKGKTQQQWLETGLPVTAAKADSGDRQSQYLLRLMLGDALPHAPNHSVWLNPGSSSDPPPRAESIEPFRVKWLSENAHRFRCDAERGIFVAK